MDRRAGKARLFTIVTFLTLASSHLFAVEWESEWLYSKRPNEALISRCSDDPLELIRSAFTTTAIKILQLSDHPQLSGCINGSYQIQPLLTSSGSIDGYRIFYPFEDNIENTDYHAPLAHELAHIYQLERAGGWAEFLEEFDSRTRELGADFLTGIVFARSNKVGRLNAFQTNLNLVGAYYEADDLAHGCPEERTMAFRFGYFAANAHPNKDTDELYEEFLNDTLHTIKCRN